MRKFKIDKDYKGIGCDIYKKKIITINAGLTVLVGCNGMGKTTLLQQLKRQLEKEKIPVISFDNLKDGGSNARDKAGFYGDFKFLVASIQSSEGEDITLNMIQFSKKIGSFLKRNKDKSEIWILLDAIDSGLSVDNVVDIKEGLFKTIFDNNPNTNIYIVISANEYELARNEQCFDVYDGKYIKFKDYEDYRNFILKTREEKDKRVYKDYDEEDEEESEDE